MNEAQISQYITEKFEGVDVVVASGDSFFFYNPHSNVPPDHKFPFVTLVTSDINDQFSNLNRSAVFRLNIGVGKQTFHTLFGEPKLPLYGSMAESVDAPSDYDFTVLNHLMPHPVYGRMYWVCILNPDDETFETRVLPLLVEAHEMAVDKYKKRPTNR